jgi:hypothetical protein
MVLQAMIDRLTGTVRDAMDWKSMCKKLKVITISRQPSPVQIMIDPKTTGECGIFQLFLVA